MTSSQQKESYRAITFSWGFLPMLDCRVPVSIKGNNFRSDLYCEKDFFFVGLFRCAGWVWPSGVLLGLAGVLLPLHGGARGAGGHHREDQPQWLPAAMPHQKS